MLLDVKNHRKAKLSALNKTKNKFEEMHYIDKNTVKDNIVSLM